MPFQTSNELLSTLPSAKLSRLSAEEFSELENKKSKEPGKKFSFAQTLTDLLAEGQRLIQDNPDHAHIDQATRIFKAVGFHAYGSHPTFDRLIIDSAKGLLICGQEYMQPSNKHNDSSTGDAQSALLHAANIITNPQFCYAPLNSEQENPSPRIRPAYADFGLDVRDNICKELLQLAAICAEKEVQPLKQSSFALDCIEWAYRLARRKSGIKAEAAKICADYTKDQNNPNGTDIRSLVGEISASSTFVVEVKAPAHTSTAGVGACSPEVVRAGHHRPVHPTPAPHPADVVAHAASPRQL